MDNETDQQVFTPKPFTRGVNTKHYLYQASRHLRQTIFALEDLRTPEGYRLLKKATDLRFEIEDAISLQEKELQRLIGEQNAKQE